jgi:hypothetical protein
MAPAWWYSLAVSVVVVNTGKESGYALSKGHPLLKLSVHLAPIDLTGTQDASSNQLFNASSPSSLIILTNLLSVVR